MRSTRLALLDAPADDHVVPLNGCIRAAANANRTQPIALAASGIEEPTRMLFGPPVFPSNTTLTAILPFLGNRAPHWLLAWREATRSVLATPPAA